jgi:hypothetical protein
MAACGLADARGATEVAREVIEPFDCSPFGPSPSWWSGWWEAEDINDVPNDPN